MRLPSPIVCEALMDYQGVIFDFNGTMFFDSRYHDEAWTRVSKELRGNAITRNEITNYVHGKNNDKIIQYILQGNVSKERSLEISLYKEKIYREICMSQSEKPVLAHGVETFLDSLVKHQIPFTIASASILENIQFFIEIFQLERWFDPANIVYDDGTHADKVSMFQEAAKRLHVAIDTCLVFEDSVSGIRFAQEAGVQAIIAIDSTNHPENYVQFPYLKDVRSDFQDLYSILENN